MTSQPYGQGNPPQVPPIPHAPPAQPAAQSHPGWPPAAPGGRIWLDLRVPMQSMSLGLITPVVTINGVRLWLGWGRTPVTAPAGKHVIQVHTSYLWSYGAATAVVPVGPGQDVIVYYRAPLVSFGAGAIGPTPQKLPGVLTFVLIMLGAAALVTLLIVLIALT